MKTFFYILAAIFGISGYSAAFASTAVPYYDCKVLNNPQDSVQINVTDLEVHYLAHNISPTVGKTLFSSSQILNQPVNLRSCNVFNNNFIRLGDNFGKLTQFNLEFSCDMNTDSYSAKIHLGPGSMSFHDAVEGPFDFKSNEQNGHGRNLHLYLHQCRLIRAE